MIKIKIFEFNYNYLYNILLKTIFNCYKQNRNYLQLQIN